MALLTSVENALAGGSGRRWLVRVSASSACRTSTVLAVGDDVPVAVEDVIDDLKTAAQNLLPNAPGSCRLRHPRYRERRRRRPSAEVSRLELAEGRLAPAESVSRYWLLIIPRVAVQARADLRTWYEEGKPEGFCSNASPAGRDCFAAPRPYRCRGAARIVVERGRSSCQRKCVTVSAMRRRRLPRRCRLTCRPGKSPHARVSHRRRAAVCISAALLELRVSARSRDSHRARPAAQNRIGNSRFRLTFSARPPSPCSAHSSAEDIQRFLGARSPARGVPAPRGVVLKNPASGTRPGESSGFMLHSLPHTACRSASPTVQHRRLHTALPD